MSKYDIVSIPGSGVFRDGTPMPHYANRISKGVDIVKGGSPDALLFLLGPSAGVAADYAKKMLGSHGGKVVSYSKGYGTLQEAKYLKKDFVDFRGDMKKIAAVTQTWHKKRTEMIYKNFFPEKEGYSVEVVGVEDGRTNNEEIMWDIGREKILTEIDRTRLLLGPIGKSEAAQTLVELGERLYNSMARA